ncbi:craniofacial development protein 2-like [Adelges cooleyi]|uniref:craniofacial development protein 2-like n=1 Tax=Adelges cooleyi TaxID=133065 RepID=UPI00217F40D1|nr:craniofacial development protein 2-like [Adelges cooleyi]
MTIFYSGGEKHERGVGFAIKNSILPNIVRFEPINDRICYVELKGKWFNILIINCYAPTDDKSEEIKNAFYEELDRICDGLPTGKPKVILGDFNAKIGKEAVYRPTIGKDCLHNDTNDNGNKLITFATASNMRISSTMFPHKNIHKQTWISPCGKVRNQIDHVMVDYRIRLSINDVRSMRGSSAVSDHFLIRTKVKFRISAEKSKRMKCTKKINKELLKINQAKDYKEKIKDYLDGLDHDMDINYCWEKMKTAIKRSAEEVLGHEPRIKRKPWLNEQCKEAVADRDKARLRVVQYPTEENKRMLAYRQREAKRIIRTNKRLWEKEKVKDIEKNRKNNTRIFFEKANEVRRSFKPRHTIIRMEDGTLLTENGKIAKAFKNMFQTLLNQPTRDVVSEECDTVEQNIERPSMQEVETGLDMLKSGKAPGAD